MSTLETISREDREYNFNTLLGIVKVHLPPEWLAMLNGLAEDVEFQGVSYLGMKDAPAAKGNHHAYLGGLVQHMLEMWNTYHDLKRFMASDDLINDSNVLQGILVHDLHKAWATFVLDEKSVSGLNYGPHPSEGLLTHNQKTLYLLGQAGVKLDLAVSNTLHCSEGGWAEKHPKWSTTLAKLVYILDEYSGNILARSRGGNNVDLRSQQKLTPLCEWELPR